MLKTIKKPWGHEYLLYQNDEVAIWHLFINPYHQTSLHSHPNKKTGLLVLDGAAKISFLGSESKLFYGEKIMIRHGVFHRTKSMTNNTLQLLEIENPVNKEDIVRLEDSYGREGSTKMGDDGVDIYQFDIRCHTIGNCHIFFKEFNSKDSFYDSEQFENFMITKGSISHLGFSVAGPGDIIGYSNVKILIDKFGLSNNLEGLAIKTC
jgi:mannose-6-phosphate isomerase-like protein (cupin superfamily)